MSHSLNDACRWVCLLVICFFVSHTVAQEIEYSDSIDYRVAGMTADSLQNDTLPWPLSLQGRVDDIVKNSKLLQVSQLGLVIYDLTADSMLCSYGGKQTLRPASTMKVITSVTALDKLGGKYQYKTRLRYTGEVIDSVRTLIGDLYLVGGMDPKFERADLLAFVETLKQMGVDTIRGNVCADCSMKRGEILGEGWCWDDDNPVLSPLVYARKDNMIDMFVDELTVAGITFIGQKQDRVSPSSSKLICSRSHYIDQILMKMMKDSDNLYAESMFYQLAYAHSRPATTAGARSEIQSLIKKMKLSPSSYKIADGSGLSLYNYVSAELLVAFLRYAYMQKNIYDHLYPSLPIAGVDGTLAKRMNNTSAVRNVRAKTGTLTGISSLAGYAKASNGNDIAFAIINQGVMSNSQAKAFQDSICIAITE